MKRIGKAKRRNKCSNWNCNAIIPAKNHFVFINRGKERLCLLCGKDRLEKERRYHKESLKACSEGLAKINRYKKEMVIQKMSK